MAEIINVLLSTCIKFLHKNKKKKFSSSVYWL